MNKSNKQRYWIYDYNVQYNNNRNPLFTPIYRKKTYSYGAGKHPD